VLKLSSLPYLLQDPTGTDFFTVSIGTIYVIEWSTALPASLTVLIVFFRAMKMKIALRKLISQYTCIFTHSVQVQTGLNENQTYLNLCHIYAQSNTYSCSSYAYSDHPNNQILIPHPISFPFLRIVTSMLNPTHIRTFRNIGSSFLHPISHPSLRIIVLLSFPLYFDPSTPS